MKARKTRGYTMIELMVTIAIFGLVLTSSGALTSGWVAAARVNGATAVINQGVSRAKAVALRNPGGVSDSATAAILCVSGSTVRLFAATRSPYAQASCLSSGGLWSAQFDTSVTLQASGAALACLAYSNRGEPVNPSAGSGSDNCATSNTVLISSASQNATITFN